MLESLHVKPDSALFIGDSPDKDCVGAHGIGMKFVQVQRSGKCGEKIGATVGQRPEYLMETLFELPQILQHIN